MEPVLYWILGFVIGLLLHQVFAIGSALGRLESKVARISHAMGIDLTKPLPLSDRVKELARDPARKIEAIKVYREETGAGLAEAKAAVEAYIANPNT
jgi:hypothetical protein